MRSLKLIFTTILLCLAAAVLVFGPRQAVEPPAGRVVVTYWEKWTGHEGEQMMQIVDEFNQTVGKDKGIYVQCLSMSNINQKTLVATAAGVPPDIAGLWDSQVAQYAAIDALEPLDELAAAHGIDASYYKTVYWEGCRYNGKLWALVSTPAAAALHYNKQLFLDKADALRAAGLDPARPPRTFEELDRYAQALDDIEVLPNGRKRIHCSGYLPLEPGWFLSLTGYWFGAEIFDPATQSLKLNDPRMIQAYQWIESYSRRLGTDSMDEFRSGFGQFNSTQNPFFAGTVAMVQQGPWLANFIENLKPSLNRWKFSKEEERKLSHEQRKDNYQWGVAPFPAVTGAPDVTYAGFDILVIPRGAPHKKEAFEFLAYVNRQDVMEKLCSMHCKNSPLRQVSREFIENHPNPYIDVFEQLAASPNAHGIPPIPIWPEVNDELTVTSQRVALLQVEPAQALAEAQARMQAKFERFRQRQALRTGTTP